jgi:hypothetical protein
VQIACHKIYNPGHWAKAFVLLHSCLWYELKKGLAMDV